MANQGTHRRPSFPCDVVLQMGEPQQITEGPLDVIMRAVKSREHHTMVCRELYAEVCQARASNRSISILGRIVERQIDKEIHCGEFVASPLRTPLRELCTNLGYERFQWLDVHPVCVDSLKQTLRVGTPPPIGMAFYGG